MKYSHACPLSSRLAFPKAAASQTNWTQVVRRTRLAQARMVILKTVAAVLGARDRLGHWPVTWSEVGIPPSEPRTAMRCNSCRLAGAFGFSPCPMAPAPATTSG